MQQTPEKKETATTPVCKPSLALISLLSNYQKEDVDYAFTHFQEIFNEWLESEFADSTEKRRSALYSLQILNELGTIITAISPKKIKQLRKQMQEFKADLT